MEEKKLDLLLNDIAIQFNTMLKMYRNGRNIGERAWAIREMMLHLLVENHDYEKERKDFDGSNEKSVMRQ